MLTWKKVLCAGTITLALLFSCQAPMLPDTLSSVEPAPDGLPEKDPLQLPILSKTVMAGPNQAINSSAPDAYENDDSSSYAKVLVADGQIQERNHYDDAADWVKVSVTSGAKYVFESWVTGVADTYFYLYDSNGTTLIKSNDDKTSVDRGSKVEWTASATKTVYLRIYSYNGRYGTNRNYTVSVTGGTIITNGDQYEEDDTYETAKALVPSVTQSHTFKDDPTDWLKFTAEAGQACTIETTIASGTDTVLSLYNTSMTMLASNDDISSSNYASRIVWTAPSNGTYYVKVNTYDNKPGDTRAYTITLTAEIVDPIDTIAFDPSNPVYRVEFTENTKEVTFTGVSGKVPYLVKSNPTATATSAASTGKGRYIGAMPTVENPQPLFPVSDGNGFDGDVAPIDLGIIRRWDDPKINDFNNRLALTVRDTTVDARESATPITYGQNTQAGFVVGTTKKNIWVEDANDQWIQAPATLRAIGDHCYIWVADANWGGTNTATGDNKISQTRVDELKNKFEGTYGIFNLVTNVFGYEYGGGTGGNGGRDSDQHVNIFIFDIGYDFTASQTGGVLGYFWGKDYYSQADIDAAGYSIKTNYTEMFYIDAHFTDGWPNIVYLTLAHEYQHMIHFNEKAIRQDLSSSTWFNEMNSMVCEDLIASKLGIQASYRPAARMDDFNTGYYLNGLTDWAQSAPNVYYSYAVAYTFGAYLARNFGGAPLFAEMAKNGYVDQNSVERALQARGYQMSFADAFRQFLQVLVYNGTSNSVTKTLNIGGNSTHNGVEYSIDPIDIYAYGNGQSSGQTMGPIAYDAATQKELRPYGFGLHTSAAWTGSSITFTFDKPAGSGVEFYLMFK
jgi:hypothetical protein